MKFLDLTSRTGEWLRGGGPLQDVVISSRVRLARNLAGMPFLTRCTHDQRADVERRLREQILQANLAPEMFYVDVAAAGELDRQLLVERHLVSRQHAAGTEGASDKKTPPKPTTHPRGVAVSGGEAPCNWSRPSRKSTAWTTCWSSGWTSLFTRSTDT